MGFPRSGYHHILSKNKYNNKHTYIDGIHFPSKREAHRYEELLPCLRAGLIQDLVVHPKFPFPMGFRYEADFSYTQPDGKKIVEDVKGFKTDVFILKEKCFKYFYPQLELRIIK